MDGNDKPEGGTSGLLIGLIETGSVVDTSILSRPSNLHKGPSMNSGFKVFPHSFFFSPVWQGASLKYRAFLTELLMRCVWKNTTCIFFGHTIELLPGQFAGSLRGMADLFSPKNLKGRAREDVFSKHDVAGAIQYFAYHRVLGQHIVHQITVLTFIDSDIYESNFSCNRTAKTTVIGRYSDSHLYKPVNQLTKDIGSKDPLAPRKSPRSSSKKDSLFFCVTNWRWEGINSQEIADWAQAYPNLSISQEIAQTTQWLKSHPEDAKRKTLWRKFLTGWLSRNNEKAVNRKAYASSGQNNQKSYSKEPSSWTKKYLSPSVDSNPNSSDSDLQEQVSLGSLLGD